MLVELIDPIAPPINDFLSKGKAAPILPPPTADEAADPGRMPMDPVGPSIVVANPTGRQLLAGDFCRVASCVTIGSKSWGGWEVVEYFGRRDPA